MKPDKRLTHLLMPKQFRVWCRPSDVPGDFHVTVYPSKANCANCLSCYRSKISGFHGTGNFAVKHTVRP